MIPSECRKCGSRKLIMRPNTKRQNQIELVCASCGAWQKFIGKDDQRLFSIRKSEGLYD